MSYLVALRRRAWIIVIVAVVFAAVAVGISLAATPQYRASARLLYEKNSNDVLVLGTAVFSSTSADREVQTGAVLTSVVADRVISELGLSMTRQELLGKVHVGSFTNTDVVELTVVSGSAAEAAEIANTFARDFVEYRSGLEQARVASAREVLQAQLDALPASDADSEYAAELRGKIGGLRVLEVTPVSGFSVVSTATAPSRSISRNTGLNVARGVVAGLIVGIIAVVVAHFFALRRVRKAGEGSNAG